MHLTDKKTEIIYAVTQDGMELPVIEIAKPAFAVDDSSEAVESLRTAWIASQKGWRARFMRRFVTRLFLKKSLLLRALVEPETAFLSGLNTYVMKLGEENLVPPFNAGLDRRIAASPPARAMRIRLQQTARLLADAVEPELTKTSMPLHLVNIGGGPAIDSINALLLLAQRSNSILRREIAIHILDVDEVGPAFGRQALAALSTAGGPLHDIDVQIEYLVYDWNDTSKLRTLMQQLRKRSVIVAASSEGALFEYASDTVVVANLRALHEAGSCLKGVAGSVTRADEMTRDLYTSSVIKLVHRGMEKFAPLAAQAGFQIITGEPALTSDQVLLRPVA